MSRAADLAALIVDVNTTEAKTDELTGKTTAGSIAVTAVYAEATGSVGVAYGYSGSLSGAAWLFHDFINQKFTLHGDLA